MSNRLLVLVLVMAGSLSDVQSQFALKKEGDGCSLDAECLDNMHCIHTSDEHNKTCSCDLHFVHKSSGTCGKAEGSWCWLKAECADRMACAENVCTCNAALLTKDDGSCGGQEGDRCDVTTDCGDHMVCSTTCTCDVNYAVTPLKTCEKPCSNPSECEPGGRCFTTGVHPTHTCICHHGYTGPTCQTPTLTYHIYISTGNSDHAATDASVGLVISGTNGTTERLKLTGSVTNWNDPFGKGTKEEFRIETFDVGEMKNITISYDVTVGDDRWFLDKVDIRRGPSGDEVFTFIFQIWIPMNTFYTLSDPCVTSSNGSCTHKGFASYMYNCTLDSDAIIPRCISVPRCQYQGATHRPEGSSVTEFECGHTQHCQDPAHATILHSTQELYNVTQCVCQSDVSGYFARLRIDKVSEFECSHTQHCQHPAHAAIITSTQELYNVTRCVCQGDVSGFFLRLRTDNDTLSQTTPISNTCPDNSRCEVLSLNNCFRHEASYRVQCPKRCGYCDNDWLSMEGGESHKYRLVSVSGDNDTSCAAVCEDYEVRVLEVGCFGANQYAKPVLCTTPRASDDDDRDWLQSPVKSTTSVYSTTKEQTTEGQTTEWTSAETTTETTPGELTTTAGPASTETTSEPATTTEETTTTTTEATTETTNTPTTTTTEPIMTTKEASTSLETTKAATYPETTFESTASLTTATAETPTSPQETCRTVCDSDTPSDDTTTTGDATPPDDTTTTDDATTRETTASEPAQQTTPAPGYYPGVFTTTCNITFPQQPPGMTRAEFLELLAEQVRKELAVNVSLLSKTRAKKTSAPDHRKSSQTAGAAAIIFMVTVALLMMLSDLSRFSDTRGKTRKELDPVGRKEKKRLKIII